LKKIGREKWMKLSKRRDRKTKKHLERLKRSEEMLSNIFLRRSQ
jgi:hypothetical protein